MAGTVNLQFSDRLKGWLGNKPRCRAVMCLSGVHEERVAEVDISRRARGLDDGPFGSGSEMFSQVEKRHSVFAVLRQDGRYIEMRPDTNPCRRFLLTDIGE